MELEVVKRWAAALLTMCEQLLDAEDTPPTIAAASASHCGAGASNVIS